MGQQTQSGDEIETLDELSSGDRITVIADEKYEVENTGTDYRIPESGWESDAVEVDGAIYEGTEQRGFGPSESYLLSDCPDSVQAKASDLLGKWIDRDNTTVVRHDE